MPLNEVQTEAIATADAYLSNTGLPSYTEVLEALRRLEGYVDTYMPSSRRLGAPVVAAHALLARAAGR